MAILEVFLYLLTSGRAPLVREHAGTEANIRHGLLVASWSRYHMGYIFDIVD